jgi:YVTN family beta-propeller protein
MAMISMKFNKKLYSITLVSAAMIFMLVSIAGAAPFAYITNWKSEIVSVIDTATNKVTARVPVGDEPYRVTVAPDGKKSLCA